MTSKYPNRGRSGFVSGLFIVACLVDSSSAMGQHTFTINSLADDGLQVSDDLICITAASECTFRTAIEAANNRSDIVIFEFSPGLETDALGRSIISPQSPLPTITQTVIIQGQTHPEFNPSQNLPRFLISGGGAGGSANGLRFEGGSEGSQIRHLAVYDFVLSGIVLAAVDDITLQDNHIDLRPLSVGTSEAVGNGGSGIVVTGSSDNLIENNWNGGNGGNGIFIASGSADNLVVGNRVGQRSIGGGIGVDLAGNLGNGVQISAGAGSDNRIGLWTGFPQETCQSNVITANEGYGVALLAGDQQVQANWIGATPEAPDNADYGNGDHGIQVESSNNTITGVLIARQVIRHNTSNGILLDGGGNQVSGNIIRDNGFNGIMVVDGGQEITQNVIGAHGWGVSVFCTRRMTRLAAWFAFWETASAFRMTMSRSPTVSASSAGKAASRASEMPARATSSPSTPAAASPSINRKRVPSSRTGLASCPTAHRPETVVRASTSPSFPTADQEVPSASATSRRTPFPKTRSTAPTAWATSSPTTPTAYSSTAMRTILI